MTIRDLLAGGAETAPAIVAPGRQPLSYGDLRRFLADAGRLLRGCRIERTDRVALVLPDGPEMATAFLAVASVAIAAPLNPRYTAAEFDFFLSDLKPRAILVEAGSGSLAVAAALRLSIAVIEVLPLAQAAAGLFELVGHADRLAIGDAPSPDHQALVLHTSGTTARPKIVPLCHRHLCASAGNVAASLHLTAVDRGLHVMPLFHIHGLVAGLLAPLRMGGSVYCTPGLDIASLADWLADARPSWITAVPTMHQAILEWARRRPGVAAGARLRFIRSCSAALPPSVAAGLEEAFGAPVLEAYAMTEAAHQISCNPLPDAHRKFGSVGPSAGPDVAVLDPEGRLLPPGETGEVAIRGENVFAGYEGDEEANRRSFVDGWFRTGDLGALDGDNYLWLSGRLKEMINRGGEKIAPIEIENLLLTHPAVGQAVAFAVPHRSLGEEVGAAIILRDGARATVDELQAHLLTTLSLPKVPRRILFVAALPKGPTGKLRRIGLAAVLGVDQADHARPAFVAPRSPLEIALSAIWERALNLPDIGANDDFFDLGGNSILALQITADVLKRTGVAITLVQLLRHPTIAGLALAITEARLTEMAPEALTELLAEVEAAQGQRA